MLTTAGFDTDTAVGGLTAFSLLEVGGLLALPIFALPAILAGVPVSRGLVHTALLGIAAFVLYAIFGVIVLRTDWPLATLGRAAQSLWNRITRGHRQPVTADPGRRPRRLRRPGHPGLPDRLLLAPPARRAAGLPAVPPPLRAPGPPARHAERGRLHRIARAYATSRRDSASVRPSARRVTDQNSASIGATVTRSFTAWASCRSSVIKASAWSWVRATYSASNVSDQPNWSATCHATF